MAVPQNKLSSPPKALGTLIKFCLLLTIASSVKNQNYTYPDAPFQNGCRIIFSEFNLNSANEQFIELGRVCKVDDIRDQRRVNLNKFKLLFISHDEKLLAACTMGGTTPFKRYWFYVVGMRGVNNLDLNIVQCNIGTIGIPGELKRLPTGSAYPLAVALLRNQKPSVLKQLDLITDGTHFFETKITNSMLQTIKNNLQDFYILGSSAPFIYCEYFNTIYPSYDKDRKTFLRDWEGTLNSVDRSLNRCVPPTRQDLSASPMQPESMKYSYITPGKQNNCQASFEAPSQPQRNKRPRLQISSCTSEFENRDEADEFMDSSDNFQMTINTQAAKVAHDHSYASSKELFQPHQVDQKTFDNVLEGMAPYVWKDCSRFSTISLMMLQNLDYTPYNAAVFVNTTYCPWLEYLSSTKKIRCKWCNMMLNQKLLIDRSGSPLITDIMKLGTGRTNANNTYSASKIRNANTKKITDHNENTFHKMAAHFFQLHDNGYRGNELIKEFEKPGGNYRNFFKATENVVVLAIQSLRMGVSFRSYKIMTETVNYFGGDIGHLYQTRSSLQTLSNALGLHLHKNLTNFLLKFRPELSVTLDSTTDVSGKSVLAIVFHTLNEDATVWVILYRVIKIRSESGQALFDTFINCIEEDGLTNYIQEKLVGLTTDGHPALRSVFRKLLDEFVSNKLISIHCIAHRVELVSAKSFERFDFLGEIDTVINDVFTFLTKKSSKRREIFRDFTLELGFKLFEVKRVRKFRWVGHHYRALVPVIQRFKVLVFTFESISKDVSFPLTDRSRAKNLLNSLKSPIFLATIAFTTDVVSGLKRLSESLQKFGDSIIGKKLLREKLIDYLMSLETINGEMLQYLLTNSFLAENNETVNDLDVFNEHTVVFDGIPLNTPNELYATTKLSSKRKSYIADLKAEIRSRFPEDIYDLLDFLHPSQFPSPGMDENYGVNQVLFLNGNLSWGYDNDELHTNWKNLLSSVINHPDYVNYKNKSAEQFWSHFLTVNENVQWSLQMIEIVRKAVTIPATSVQNERIFSMYAYIKTLRRFNLLVSTVENILRVLFNGPKEIKQWNTFEVAKGVLDYMSRPDDVTRRATWNRTQESEDFLTFDEGTGNDEDDLGDNEILE